MRSGLWETISLRIAAGRWLLFYRILENEFGFKFIYIFIISLNFIQFYNNNGKYSCGAQSKTDKLKRKGKRKLGDLEFYQ
jgi:hypothetical protein